MAAPVDAEESAASALDFDSGSGVVNRIPRRRTGMPGWLTAAVLIVLVFGGAVLAVIAVIRLIPNASDLSAEEKTAFIQQGNFSIVPPTTPWQQDKILQAAMKVDLAYRRTGPSSVMALAFKDYRTRLPRNAELIDAALIKIRSYLGSVEYELQPKNEETKLAGQPAAPTGLYRAKTRSMSRSAANAGRLLVAASATGSLLGGR